MLFDPTMVVLQCNPSSSRPYSPGLCEESDEAITGGDLGGSAICGAWRRQVTVWNGGENGDGGSE